LDKTEPRNFWGNEIPLVKVLADMEKKEFGLM
jgi:hypothetical protein